MSTDRAHAEEWLDRLAACAERMAGRGERTADAVPADPIWRDDAGNVLTKRPDGRIEHVMVQYERPMMEAVADIIAKPGATVLNVGFGCGLVDEAIQRRGAARHVIIEAHPQVISWMHEAGWDKRPGVEIVHAPWQDVVWNDYAQQFDGVFFDTYPYGTGREWDQLLWHEVVHRILKPRTGVGVLYRVGWTQDKVDALVRGFWRDDVTVGHSRCTVDVPFEVTEWEALGVGTHEIDIPYFSLHPKGER